MPFNVNDIVSSINTSGVAKASHFDIFIHGAGDAETERDMQYRADATELPGRGISTAEHSFNNYGPINKVAYGQTYGDVSISFLLSEDIREKEYFEIWQDQMVNTGAFNTSGNSRENATRNTYNVRYFDNYARSVTIRQYSSGGELRAIHTLNEAYPIVINPIAMAWGEDSALRMNVTFAYKNYSCVFTKQNQATKGIGGSFKIDRDGISGSISVPGFGNISGAFEKGRSAISASVGSAKNKIAVIRSLF